MAVLEAFMAFLNAIDWSESWIWWIGLFHVILLCLILLTRTSLIWQSSILFFILALCLALEPINSLASKYANSFTQYSYFHDPHGYFISTLVGFPLLLCSAIILIQLVIMTTKQLIQVKRQQLINARDCNDDATQMKKRR